MYKQKGCCLTSLFLLPFKIMWLFVKPFLYIIGAIALFTCAITFASIPLILLGCAYLILFMAKRIFKKLSNSKHESHEQDLESISNEVEVENEYRNDTPDNAYKHFYYTDYLDKMKKKEKEKQDFERFMIECNAYVEHQEEMEHYKDMLEEGNDSG